LAINVREPSLASARAAGLDRRRGRIEANETAPLFIHQTRIQEMIPTSATPFITDFLKDFRDLPLISPASPKKRAHARLLWRRTRRRTLDAKLRIKVS
jgi:hypothetical protein